MENTASQEVRSGVLHEISMVLGDIHQQVTSLEERLNLVSTRSKESTDVPTNTLSANGAHVSSLLESANLVRAKIGRLYEELSI